MYGQGAAQPRCIGPRGLELWRQCACCSSMVLTWGRCMVKVRRRCRLWARLHSKMYQWIRDDVTKLRNYWRNIEPSDNTVPCSISGCIQDRDVLYPLISGLIGGLTFLLYLYR